MLRGLKSYQPSKFESVYFLSKTGLTFLLWPITFEPLKQKQSYIPLLKVLMCGMNAWGAQWHGGIFILQYTSLKMVLLLHKTALVNFPMATTVLVFSFIFNLLILLDKCKQTYPWHKNYFWPQIRIQNIFLKSVNLGWHKWPRN